MASSLGFGNIIPFIIILVNIHFLIVLPSPEICKTKFSFNTVKGPATLDVTGPSQRQI